ncbi:MAG: hypothetical protein LBK61_11975 [Spirochaetaceae bacterium]|nr:hypothetical protein [Spirochaetaceae bacterium]
MPLRGAKTQPGFHPFANHFRCETYPDLKPIPILAEIAAVGRSAPAGSENPQGFHPFAQLSPILAEIAAAGRQNTPLWRLCAPLHGKPFGRAMPP